MQVKEIPLNELMLWLLFQESKFKETGVITPEEVSSNLFRVVLSLKIVSGP